MPDYNLRLLILFLFFQISSIYTLNIKMYIRYTVKSLYKIQIQMLINVIH